MFLSSHAKRGDKPSFVFPSQITMTTLWHRQANIQPSLLLANNHDDDFKYRLNPSIIQTPQFITYQLLTTDC